MPPSVVIDPTGDLLLQIPIQPSTPLSDDFSWPGTPSTVATNTPIFTNPQEAHEGTGNVDRPETQELQVASKVLAVASPVFRALIYGQFSEAVDISKARNATDSPLTELPLPEDDAEAMMLLCKVLHFAIGDIPNFPEPQLLERLACVCDKYCCVQVLKFCGGIWVRNWLVKYKVDPPETPDICRLFIFTYVAGLESEFSDIAWTLLLHHRGPFSKPGSTAARILDHPLLLSSVLSR
ncbi:hypothetical protein jhhlp_004954 [Lomentospora prolificans]|uniref:BTB domain-containing protein n=1 Tax=Lomentospora prolificans TaxID=41688 RepID=A0A2N3N816_9PEZI|nr:hypothetical protein jhhlp_004954 [Lomentospora prolificans]